MLTEFDDYLRCGRLEHEFVRVKSNGGSIEAGKTADLIVLDRNLLTIPPSEISETEVLETIIDGQVVHRAH